MHVPPLLSNPLKHRGECLGTLLASIGGPIALEMVKEIAGRVTFTPPHILGIVAELRARGAPWVRDFS